MAATLACPQPVPGLSLASSGAASPEPQAYRKGSSGPRPQTESTCPENEVCPGVLGPFCSASGPGLTGGQLGPQNGGRACKGCRPEATRVAAL